MTSYFADALKKGLEASEVARKAKEEIEDVLKVASSEISLELQKEVQLSFKQVDEPAREQTLMESHLGMAAPRRKALKLHVRIKTGHWAALADVEQGEYGYPVILSWSNQRQDASDRAGLVSALAAVLSSPGTGEKILGLVANTPAA